MSVFSPISTATTEVQIANQIRNLNRSSLNQLLAAYTKNYTLVWDNPKSTPDKIVAAFGADAVQLFTVAAQTAAYLTAMGATGFSTTMPSGWTYVANHDGSVTLTKNA